MSIVELCKLFKYLYYYRLSMLYIHGDCIEIRHFQDLRNLFTRKKLYIHNYKTVVNKYNTYHSENLFMLLQKLG